jgi:hypothetical protein
MMSSLLNCYTNRKVYRAEGIPGLWAGVTSAMARVAVGSSLQLSSYDTIKVRTSVDMCLDMCGIGIKRGANQRG